MASFEWSFDAPTGTFKQNALSKKLYQAAVEDTTFMDHVKPISSFGRKQGENVTLTRIANLTEPTSAVLTEGVRIPEDDFSVTTTSITVSEIGRSVPYTSLAEDLSFFDVENQIQRVLRDQMKLSLDSIAAVAFTAGQVKYVPTGLASATVTTNGTAGAAAAANMNLWHVEEIRDYLYDTIRVPQIGNDYVAIFRTLGLRGIKRDPAWEEWFKYTNPSQKFNSEVGRLEGIRFIETNHNNALQKVGTNSVLGEGVVFGEDAVALAEVLTPELRAAIPGDFGRAKAVAWYGILQAGQIWGDSGSAGEARVLHVTST